MMQNQLFKETTNHTKNYSKIFIYKFLVTEILIIFHIQALTYNTFFFKFLMLCDRSKIKKSSIKGFSQIWFQMNYENNKNLSIHFYIVGYLLQNWNKNLAIFLNFFQILVIKNPKKSFFWTFLMEKSCPLKQGLLGNIFLKDY